MRCQNFAAPELPVLRSLAGVVRRHIAGMYFRSSNGHYGGSFSCVEILNALYFAVLRVRPGEPRWPGRDRFVMSKGHCAGTLFAVLAERGYFGVDWLEQYECFDCKLNTHPNMRKVPGLDISSGSLGHGLSAGVGMALAAKMDKTDYRTFVLLGDGELTEGSVWEAAMSANKYRLGNLIAVVDRNRFCVGGTTAEVMPLEPLDKKWESFGWSVFQCDGHDYEALLRTFDRMLSEPDGGRPKVMLADTVKGKGVSFMENNREWHAKHIDRDTHERIMTELAEGREIV